MFKKILSFLRPSAPDNGTGPVAAYNPAGSASQELQAEPPRSPSSPRAQMRQREELARRQLRQAYITQPESTSDTRSSPVLDCDPDIFTSDLEAQIVDALDRPLTDTQREMALALLLGPEPNSDTEKQTRMVEMGAFLSSLPDPAQDASEHTTQDRAPQPAMHSTSVTTDTRPSESQQIEHAPTSPAPTSPVEQHSPHRSATEVVSQEVISSSPTEASNKQAISGARLRLHQSRHATPTPIEVKPDHIPAALPTQAQADEAQTLAQGLQSPPPAGQRSLLDKGVAFLNSLPNPIQKLIEHQSKRLTQAPAMQAKLRELDELQEQARRLENGPPDAPPAATPPTPAPRTPPAPATPTPPPPQPNGAPLPVAAPVQSRRTTIQQQMHDLQALEAEQAILAEQGELSSPSAKLKAKELELRMAMLVENMLSMMKMIADINKRSNQIATNAI